MKTIPTKTILSKNKYPNFWFGNDFNMNLYRGCHHGCIYCDSRSECYQNDEFDTVKVKENALNILKLELSKKRTKAVVGMGAMSDSYNAFEKDLEVTRGALKLLRDYHFGVSLETKSDLIVRDIDLFKEIQKYNDVIIKMTITTFDDELSCIIEPNASLSSKRFEAMKKLSAAGLFCGILLHPILPFINDTEENVIQIVKKSYESGARFVHGYFGVTLRDRQRTYYFNKLDQYYPGLKEKYLKTYGHRYECLSVHHKNLENILKRECQKYGLLYKMSDIIKAYKHENKVEQLSLF